MKDVLKDLWPLVALFLGFFVLWVLLGGPDGRFANSGTGTGTRVGSFSFLPSVRQVPEVRDGSGSGGAGSDGAQDTVELGISPWEGKVRLQSGNGRYETDPDREYVVIQTSRSDEAVDITGWVLMNAKDNQPIRSGVNEFYYPNADRVTIGLGARVVSNTGGSGGERIVVPKGGRAIVATGHPPDTFPALIKTSFLDTKCTGYLAEGGVFPAGVGGRCVSPRNEPGIDTISNACYDFVRTIGSCRIPTYERMERAEISNQCRKYIDEHFNYKGCVTYHQYDSDFFSDVWHVFLFQSTELWSRSGDTISLFDENGLLVDQISW